MKTSRSRRYLFVFAFQQRALYGPTPVKTETCEELSGPLVHTNFGKIHMDQSLLNTFSWGDSYGPMVLKILQRFSPTLALVHGWLFPAFVRNPTERILNPGLWPSCGLAPILQHFCKTKTQTFFLIFRFSVGIHFFILSFLFSLCSLVLAFLSC